MIFTLAFFVFLAAIIVSFSEELIKFIKKILAIPGIGLFLPLLLATFLVLKYEKWVMLSIQQIKIYLLFLIHWLNSLNPISINLHSLITVLLILIVSLLPGIILNIKHKRATLAPYPHTWFLTLMIWLLFMFTLVLG